MSFYDEESASPPLPLPLPLPRVGIVSVQRESRGFGQWLAHHASIGVDRVFLRFEGDVGPLTAATVKENAHWVKVLEHDDNPNMSVTFDEVAKRCEAFATRVVSSRDTDVDWVIHIDADELVHCPAGIKAVFGSVVPEDAKTVRLDTLEAVLNDANADGSLLPFGDDCAVSFRTPLATQAAGRAAGRVGPGNAGRGQCWFTGKPVHFMDSANAVVLHFECLTMADWLDKFWPRVTLTPLEFRRMALDYYRDSVQALQRSATDTHAHAAVFRKYRTAAGHASLGRPNVRLQHIFFRGSCQPEATTSPCQVPPPLPSPAISRSASPRGTTSEPTTTTPPAPGPAPGPLDPRSETEEQEQPRFSTPVGPRLRPLQLPPQQPSPLSLHRAAAAAAVAAPAPVRLRPPSPPSPPALRRPSAPPLRSTPAAFASVNGPPSSWQRSARPGSSPEPRPAPRLAPPPSYVEAPACLDDDWPPEEEEFRQQQQPPFRQQHQSQRELLGAQQRLLFGRSRSLDAPLLAPPSPPSSTSGRKPGHLGLLGFTVMERRTAPMSSRKGGLLY